MARRLTGLGLSVIPLRARDKRPDGDALPKGADGQPTWAPFQERLAADEELCAWFGDERGDRRNIGIVTGQVSGVVVVDSDSADAETFAQSRLPETSVKVQTAKGVHRYYRHPGDGEIRNAVKILADGNRLALDVKGDGGYVVAPGSTHETGHQYRAPTKWPDSLESLPVFDRGWLPAEDRPVRLDAPIVVPASILSDRAQLLRRARAYVEKVEPALQGNGGDVHTFKLCCRLKRGFNLSDAEALDVLASWNAGCVPPWTDQELITKLRGADKYGRESVGELAARPAPPSAPATSRADISTSSPVDTKPPVSSPNEWPAPLGAAALIGVFGDLVRAMEPHTEADPVSLLLQQFAMFGNAIGRTAHFRAEADRHFLNLFAVLVGTSSKARKGVSLGRTRRIYESIDESWLLNCQRSGLSSGEGLIWSVRDPIEKQNPVKHGGRIIEYQTAIEDPGVTDKRLLITETELASTLRVLARDGNTLSALMRQAWDGLDLRVLTKNSPAKATGAHISVIGHITRDEVRRYLDATEAANGFGNRFLWCCVRRSKLLPEGGGDPHLEPLIARVREAVEHARGMGEMRRDAAARVLWHQVYGRLSEGRPGLLGSMTARAEAQVMRLACLYALGDCSAVIGRPHLEAALEVWRYCFDSARYIFGQSLGDPTADLILQSLQASPDGLLRSEISIKVFGRNMPAPEIARALGVLEDAWLVKKTIDAETGGRHAERWIAVAGYERTKETKEGGSGPISGGGSFVSFVSFVGHSADSVAGGVPELEVGEL